METPSLDAETIRIVLHRGDYEEGISIKISDKAALFVAALVENINIRMSRHVDIQTAIERTFRGNIVDLVKASIDLSYKDDPASATDQPWIDYMSLLGRFHDNLERAAVLHYMCDRILLCSLVPVDNVDGEEFIEFYHVARGIVDELQLIESFDPEVEDYCWMLESAIVSLQ